MPAPSIRLATSMDAATVAGFVHALLHELTGGTPPAIEDVTRNTKTVLAGTGVVAVLALVDGTPVGVMTLNECAAIYAGGTFGEISELYV
ncbi:MAG: GNAT family N-acetyltransferase, partial [Pseudorhodobacter sp.]|nr:GNAT family N-acetyltransferase [Pseudorhodobacter sp.]